MLVHACVRAAQKQNVDYVETSGILKVLGHPVRLEMVRNLMRDECNVSRIVERLGIPQSTVSQHLRVLQDRGILRPRKEGVRTCYAVVDARVRRIVQMLEEDPRPQNADAAHATRSTTQTTENIRLSQKSPVYAKGNHDA